jgi:hypothetical protein
MPFEHTQEESGVKVFDEALKNMVREDPQMKLLIPRFQDAQAAKEEAGRAFESMQGLVLALITEILENARSPKHEAQASRGTLNLEEARQLLGISLQ